MRRPAAPRSSGSTPSAIRWPSAVASGYLPGGIAFWDGLTGERLLDELADLSGRPPIRRAELVERLELSERTLRRTVRDYSRGMRQKLGIVQALQHDPELAILDEPTEGLDPLMQRAFYEILDELRAAGRTIFFSSHILSEVERVCDRVAIVRAGRLVALEEIPALLARRKRNVETAARQARRRRSRASRASRELRVTDGLAHLPPRGRRGPVPGGHRRRPDHGPDDRARAPRGGVHGVLRARRAIRRLRWRRPHEPRAAWHTRGARIAGGS